MKLICFNLITVNVKKEVEEPTVTVTEVIKLKEDNQENEMKKLKLISSNWLFTTGNAGTVVFFGSSIA